MNILYISRLNGRPWAGPTYSVPMQIASQSKFDNVFWYNQWKGSKSDFKEKISEWRNNPYYADLDDFPNGKIEDLPAPFNSPDLIVVEQCYPFYKSNILRNIINKYPYIVVPRGELTYSAQNIKSWKKKLANFFVYNRFIKHAIAIQFLTQNEKSTTSDSWYKESLIAPNGTLIPNEYKTAFANSGINCVSIGRISVFHKGIDLLIDACTVMKKELIDADCKIYIYGPDRENVVPELNKQLELKGISSIISFHDGLYGKDKEKVYYSSDVFIMTSRFEGHPTGLLEALSYGLPCLVTTGSNMRDEIEKNNAGWTADNSVESIVVALRKIIDEKMCFCEKGENARLLALDFAWDTIAKNSHNSYLRLIEERIKNNGSNS